MHTYLYVIAFILCVAFRHILSFHLIPSIAKEQNKKKTTKLFIEHLTASRSASGYKVHSTSQSDFLLFINILFSTLFGWFFVVVVIVVGLIAADTTVSAYFVQCSSVRITTLCSIVSCFVIMYRGKWGEVRHFSAFSGSGFS